MPSFRLTYDPTGHPHLEEEFCGGPPLDSDLVRPRSTPAVNGSPNWTLSHGAAEPDREAADRRAPAPFQFAAEGAS